MAFDKEQFVAWLQLNGVKKGFPSYPPSLSKLEQNYSWDLNALLPAGADSLDQQLTQDIAALDVATHRKQRKRLGDMRLAFRRYDDYVRDRDHVKRRPGRPLRSAA